MMKYDDHEKRFAVHRSPRIGLIVLLSICCIFVGCTVRYAARWNPNSHFVYPNSNVTELGPAKAEMIGDTAILLGIPDFQTAEMDLKIYQKALSQVAGANLIVDYVLINHTRQVFIFYSWTTMEIDGTAVKMEVGEQTLR